MPKTIRGCLLAALSLSVVPSVASAHDPRGGGASAPERPQIESVACAGESETECVRGETLRVSGENLRTARLVVFLGRRGRSDNRRARASSATPHRLRVRIPSGARSGRVRVVSAYAGRSTSKSRIRVLRSRPAPVAASPGPDGGVFPVRGAYDFGTRTNRYGGGRDHKGQDVFAKCGTPIVSALAGEVTFVKWHDRAGHYAVITAEDGTSQAYMHLRRRAMVSKGSQIAAGQQIGEVGDTGRATGCHLHFELWTAPGWYAGGEPIDPLPTLKRWAEQTPP